MYECHEEHCGWTGDTPDEDASAAQYCPECGGDVQEVCADTAADEDRVISAAEEVIRPRKLN